MCLASRNKIGNLQQCMKIEPTNLNKPFSIYKNLVLSNELIIKVELHYMFCGSVQRFRFAVTAKHSTFRTAMAVSHYFCFWTACCKGSKDTLAKFENAVLVDVYNYLCVYRCFSRYSLRMRHTFNNFEQHSLLCSWSFYHSLTTWHIQ